MRVFLSFAVTNRCLVNYGGCSQVCTFDGLESHCSCDPGYILQRDGHTCVYYEFHVDDIPTTTKAATTVATTTPTTATTATPTTATIATTVPTTATTVATTIPTTATTPTVAATECPPVVLPKLPLCGEILTAETGSFTSPNWPLTYNTNEECEWIIHIPDCSKGIAIEFDGFSIAGRMPGCDKDQVTIKEGMYGDAKSFGPLCHLSIPAPMTLSSNMARVVMSAGPSHGRRRLGFSATYHAVDL